MPFAVTAWPSLGLGLLKAGLAQAGVAAEVLYLNAMFADQVGDSAYEPLSIGAPQNTDLLGEWVFADALWGSSPERDDRYFAEILKGGQAAHRKHLVDPDVSEVWRNAITCRAQVERYLDDCVEKYDWAAFRIVGFTSVFQQHLASLALAKRLKARFPNLTIVFGGANCEGPMGLATLRNFPFIDAVCVGEGDVAFPLFVQRTLSGTAHEPSNIVTREQLQDIDGADGGARPTPDLVDLNALPFPDFDDFFEQCGHRPESESIPVRIVFETSRGCWWGQKNHCTFCGLNGTTMAFRYKAPLRAIEEIQHLTRRYGRFTQQLSASDNIIPYQYFAEFLPELIKLDMKLSIFYETKSNLRKDQLTIYRDAGLMEIQPGIESLDTNVLRLMKKGVSGIQNIQLLKWCKELGISPLWNYLYGFPGELSSSYDDIAKILPVLSHLDPPTGMGRLRFDRFSPYLDRPGEFGVTGLKPYPAYEYIYPYIDADQRQFLAYYFTGDFESSDTVDRYTETLRAGIRKWQAISPDSMLSHVEDENSTTVFDGRNGDDFQFITLSGLYHKVFLQSDGIISASQLDLTNEEGERLPSVLTELEKRGLIFLEGDRILRLSLPLVSDYEPPPKAMARLRSLLVEKEEAETAERLLTIDSKNVVALEI